jgi:hypothetical protein
MNQKQQTPPPWVPSDSPGATAAVVDGDVGPDEYPGELRAAAAAALFDDRQNYSVDDIADSTGFPLDAVIAAGERREISSVCSANSRARLGKTWRGPAIRAWVTRCGLPLRPPAWAKNQIGGSLRAADSRRSRQEADRARAEQEKTDRENFYRGAAARSPALVDVFEVLNRMAHDGMKPADVLRLLKGQ